MKQKLDLIFQQGLIKEPVIYDMSRKVPVVFNIRRAKVTDTVGEIVLELEGSEPELANAKKWLQARGVKVEPVTHDTFES